MQIVTNPALPPMLRKSLPLAVLAALAVPQAQAFQLNAHPDWNIRLDTTVQYTAGWRVEDRDDAIGNHPSYASSNYKFDRCDMVTSRFQARTELHGIDKARRAIGLSGSASKDRAR